MWLKANPYEVIAIMMGNGDRVAPTEYIKPFQHAGLIPFIYVPPYKTMTLDQWPKLSEMILQNKRVVVTLDYNANQSAVPWLLDEFAYQWQTPFSPTNTAFPCTVERPANQSVAVSRNKMYMVNHNLNIRLPASTSSFLNTKEPILLPGRTYFQRVNAVNGYGSLGRSVENCTALWGRPPNWLLVDYYNHGDLRGSVFQVAATANNVSYNRDSCCGAEKKSSAIDGKTSRLGALLFVQLSVFWLLL